MDQVDYSYVGYYHCVKNHTETAIDESLDTLVENGLASRIYLFVDGSIFGFIHSFECFFSFFAMKRYKQWND